MKKLLLVAEARCELSYSLYKQYSKGNDQIHADQYFHEWLGSHSIYLMIKDTKFLEKTAKTLNVNISDIL